MTPLIAVTQGAVIEQLAFEQAARQMRGRRAGRKARRRRPGH